MKEAEIIKNLKDFQNIEPDEKWYHVNRSILLNIIEKDTAGQKKTFSAKSMFFSFYIFTKNILPNWKVALSSFLAVAMVGGTVFGATGSVPGQTLYPVKMGVEKIELTLASSDEQATKIRLQHIDNRIEEIKKLSESNEAQNHISTITANIQENLSGIQGNLKSIETKDNVNKEDLVELVKLVDEKTIAAAKTLKEVNADSKQITEIAKTTNDLGQRALEIIIDKGNTDEQKLVANSLNTKIQLQEDRINDVSSKIQEITKDLPQQSDKSATSTSTVESEKQIEFGIDQIQKIDPSQITGYLKLAKELIEKGDYKGALLEVEKAQFNLDLCDKVLDNVAKAGYAKDIQNIEQNIKDAEKSTSTTNLKK